MSNSLVIFLSDLHVGKTLPHFNNKVFAQRLQSIPKQLATRNLRFSEIVLILGGDIVDGEHIYPHHAAVTKDSLLQQTVIATREITKLVNNLAGSFDAPIVIHNIPGNHGRASKIHHPDTNFDTIVGMKLALTYQDSAHVTVSVARGEFKLIKVQQTKLLLYHEGLKHIGSPANQLKFLNWMVEFGADALLHGHHHTLSFTKYGRWWKLANGSLAGKDDYGEKLACFDGPAQMFFQVGKGGIYGLDYFRWPS